IRLLVADVLNIVEHHQSGTLGIKGDAGRVGGRRHLQSHHFGGSAIGRLRFSRSTRERHSETAHKNNSTRKRHVGISFGAHTVGAGEMSISFLLDKNPLLYRSARPASGREAMIVKCTATKN